MATLLKVLGYNFQPSAHDEQRLLHLMARYTQLCDALAEVARAHPDYLYAGQLSEAEATKKVAASFRDIPSRFVNIACSRVLKTLRSSGSDYRFADHELSILELDEKVVSVQIPSRKITEEPVRHISIAVDGDGRLIVPCEVELRENQPAKKVGGAQLVHYRHNGTWFVMVTAELAEDSALLKNEPHFEDEQVD